MFHTWSHEALQLYWWAIVSLLGGLLVFLLFIQGGQSLLAQFRQETHERSLVVNILGHKWELGFTTLVLFGGAIFAAFPQFYATSFGGAYWAWMLILFCYILQAVSYEYRSKPGNLLGRPGFELFLQINGFLAPLLLGIALGTLYTGAHFVRGDMNLTSWVGPLRGLEALMSLQGWLLGLSLVFLSRALALQYLLVAPVRDEQLRARWRSMQRANSIPAVVFLVLCALWLMQQSGLRYAADGMVFRESLVYLNNLLQMPLVGLMFLVGLALLLAGLALGTRWDRAIWLSGPGTVLLVWALLLIAGLNGTSFYPSIADPASSLTIANASSSQYTLGVMGYVSLLVPFVLAYISYVWRLMGRGTLDAAELARDPHSY